MDFRKLVIGGRLVFFVIHILIVMACITFIDLYYKNNILPDKLVQETFIENSCVVTEKKLSTKGHIIHRYRADFMVSYQVGDTPYHSWVTGNGLDIAYYRHRDVQEDALTQFSVGASYPCWYNPKYPQIAVLVLRHDFTSTVPLLVPTIISIIAMFYILKGILQFFGVLSSKTREIIKKKRRLK